MPKNLKYISVSETIYRYVRKNTFANTQIMDSQMYEAKDLLFHHPCNIMVCGSTQSGKTQWTAKFIKFHKKLFDKQIKNVLYCYGVHSEDVLDFEKQGIKTHFGLPTEDMLRELNDSLVILDDLLPDAKPAYLDKLFTRLTHHLGLSLIFITQDIFTKNLRVPRVNAHYVVLLKNKPGERQIRDLGLSLFPRKGDFQYFFESYLKATDKNWGYLLIDSHSASNELLRLRTNIFPDERPLVVFLPKSQ